MNAKREVDVGGGYHIVLRLEDDGEVRLSVWGPHEWEKSVWPTWGNGPVWPLKKLYKGIQNALALIAKRREKVRCFEEDLLPQVEAMADVLKVTGELEAELA